MVHMLIIALTMLLTLSLEAPKNEDFMATCSISDAPYLPVRPKLTELLDKNSEAELSDIVVPPDITPMQLGDHFESTLEKSNAFESNIADLIGHTTRNSGDDKNGTGGGDLKSRQLFLDDVLNIGDGQPSPGHGGGWGGGVGFSSDHSNGNTSTGFVRYQSFGTRCLMCRRHSCSSGATENCVVAALLWLAQHQESDGHWDTVRLGSRQKTDTAMTGLALLAFAGAGHTEKAGRYRDNVKRAVAWLESKPQANGLIFDSTDAGGYRGTGYPHAIATLALAEAAGMGNVKQTRAAAQRAMDYATDTLQSGEGSDKLGWRYAPGQAGDLSVTGWYVMAMKSAKLAGLNVRASAFEGAMKFLDSVEIHDGGATRFGYQPGAEHPETAHLLTAIGTLARRTCGWTREQAQDSVEWFVEKGGVPAWGANGESVDLYYWYYGSLCAFQQDGDVWKRFNHGMVQTLTKNQCKTGDDAGSCPVVGEFSSEWGRVGQTALSALCLEVYYRYEKLKN